MASLQSRHGSASSDPEVEHQMEQRCQKKTAALWRKHSAVAMGNCVARYNAYHTNKNNKANNAHSLQGDSHYASTKCLIQTLKSF